MITPVSPTFLKQEAKKLKKSQGLQMSKALDEVSKKYGFSNYRHYLNVYESNSKQVQVTKEDLLKIISLEKDTAKKMDLAISFIKESKILFRDSLDVLKQFKHSKRAIQTVCEKLNLMKKEIHSFMFNAFLTDEGQYEVNFRAPNFVTKEISIMDISYEIRGDNLSVDGNYVLETEFEFELDENDPVSKDERFKNRKFDGHFEVEINRHKKITLVHSDMSIDNGLTPMRGFTKEEVEDYYKRFPEEDGRFDDIL
ncbi:hypothetical protein [Legionella spiritensis]|uniref:Uncharacterized protein n=1 Tax=Legionella spiritensis TaxID=452 RepID=A0A0W0YYY3_LEGSP|nr:hypothetical protein [Legionella spiritensis]KTD62117.1 hypothetical protein Lspi_1967 [Legionella spiritensis]SNV34146.1 Uncharacterised protein [Legionella spiritensis]VEG92514.1 Uncharacterised protein [Legionella spiritensis]